MKEQLLQNADSAFREAERLADHILPALRTIEQVERQDCVALSLAAAGVEYSLISVIEVGLSSCRGAAGPLIRLHDFRDQAAREAIVTLKKHLPPNLGSNVLRLLRDASFRLGPAIDAHSKATEGGRAR